MLMLECSFWSLPNITLLIQAETFYCGLICPQKFQRPFGFSTWSWANYRWAEMFYLESSYFLLATLPSTPLLFNVLLKVDMWTWFLVIPLTITHTALDVIFFVGQPLVGQVSTLLLMSSGVSFVAVMIHKPLGSRSDSGDSWIDDPWGPETCVTEIFKIRKSNDILGHI